MRGYPDGAHITRPGWLATFADGAHKHSAWHVPRCCPIVDGVLLVMLVLTAALVMLALPVAVVNVRDLWSARSKSAHPSGN